jgi:hypothetical protein
MTGKLGLTVVMVVATLAGTASAAHAQRSPDTATLDRGDGFSRIGLDLGLTFLDAPPSPYNPILRIEPYGQYVTDSGFGFYGALPIAKSFGDLVAPLPEPTLAFGNLDLGALYVQSRETSSYVFRLGIAFPTAGESRDDVPTNILGSTPRFTDIALGVPDAAYLRVAFSPLFHSRNFFLRFDVGFDFAIDTNDDLFEPGHFFRLNVGGGVDLGAVAVGLELVNLAQFDDADDNDQFLHNLAFTLRFMGEGLQPFLAVGSPIDDGAREQIDLFLAFGIQFLP